MSDTPQWNSAAPIENLRRRAAIIAAIRAFFVGKDVLEVDTPVMSNAAVSDPYIDTIECRYQPLVGGDVEMKYLQSSPEYAMKRLLASGSGPIYQISKAFRNGEVGRRHNPEFSMLEWYRPGFDHRQLMTEVAELLLPLLGLSEAVEYSYAQVFKTHLGIDPHSACVAELRTIAAEHIDSNYEDDNRDNWLNLLMSHVIEPRLASEGAVFVYDYPASQAALAKVSEDAQGRAVAERFELFVHGVELANGYHELTDATEQARRFEADNRQRGEENLPQRPVDDLLIAALENGMPDCAGVAVGIDRLVMQAIGTDNIADVIAFPLPLA
ncbi:EF-P lysine aminoacylase EpmA [Aliamphritea spongicola]|uniref:EF-P lysine aminoacylase EpmA n=1 Tax=Aliamphritea spongicola TaxID=707589 RepID=UPI00196B06FB|nr:EF-P lysine aminoacylase EpmA [Aliamphritea spongicola]MBN3563883.1 EF-P lysine aminoacylase GenX [Aliamphritea spongicola]